MNWRLSALDRFALVSNSDAHSPSKIGREANVFDTDFSFRGLIDALRTNDPAKFLDTVEFFPEEGKYHYDGHRKCGVVFAPRESLKTGDICPKCGKKLTIGVLHRVEELADREPGEGAAGPRPLQEPHPAQRGHRRGPGQDARMPGRLGPLFPVHPRVRGRACHPDRSPRGRAGPGLAGEGRRGRRSDAQGTGLDPARPRRRVRPDPHLRRGAGHRSLRFAALALLSPKAHLSRSRERTRRPPTPKPRGFIGASISGDLAGQEADEGSFRGNRQNVFERGVAHAERVVLAPSPTN